MGSGDVRIVLSVWQDIAIGGLVLRVAAGLGLGAPCVFSFWLGLGSWFCGGFGG